MPITADDELLPLTAEAASAMKGATSPVELLRRLLNSKGPATTALQALGLNCAALSAALPAGSDATGCDQVMRNASREARLLGHRRVGDIHLLLALLYRDSPVTADLLGRHDVSLYDLRRFQQSPAAATQTARLRRPGLPSLRGVVRPSPVFFIPVGGMALFATLLLAGVPSGLVGLVTTGFVISGWITSLCLHEFGHALTAYLGGDRSVANRGYLSLNPLKYANPLMSIVFPVVFVLLGGLGLPGGAVYIDHAALRSRRWDALVSAAGPLATLLFALVTALPFLVFPAEWWFTGGHLAFGLALSVLVVVEIGALLLNLLPIPPLDGFGILAALFLSWETRLQAARLGLVTMTALFFVLWQTPAGTAFRSAIVFLAALLHVL